MRPSVTGGKGSIADGGQHVTIGTLPAMRQPDAGGRKVAASKCKDEALRRAQRGRTG